MLSNNLLIAKAAVKAAAEAEGITYKKALEIMMNDYTSTPTKFHEPNAFEIFDDTNDTNDKPDEVNNDAELSILMEKGSTETRIMCRRLKEVFQYLSCKLHRKARETHDTGNLKTISHDIDSITSIIKDAFDENVDDDIRSSANVILARDISIETNLSSSTDGDNVSSEIEIKIHID